MVSSIKASDKSSNTDLQPQPRSEAIGSRNRATWQSRFKQAACLSLLGSPFAAAIEPTQPRIGSAARRLLANNDPCAKNTVYGPYAGALPSPLPLASTSLAVLGNYAWSQYLCVDGQPGAKFLNSSSIPITYTFGPSTPINATDRVDTTAENFAIMDFVRVAQTVGVQSNRIDYETGDALDVPSFAFGASNKKGHNPWETTGLEGSVDDIDRSHVFVYAYNADVQDFAWRISVVAQGLGLKARGQPGFGGVEHDIGNFAKDTLSSVTFMDSAPCANVTRMGALDLRALADLYGFAKGMDANAVITLDNNFGSGGLIASSDTNNTLCVTSDSDHAVQVYLGDDGMVDSFVGPSVARLAPGSVITTANISATNGGVIVGNQYDNVLFGSVHNDTFVVGSKSATITLNGGHDLVALPFNTSVAYISDMNRNSSIWFASGASTKISPYGSGGSAVVDTLGGAQAFVTNMQPSDVKPLVFAGDPSTSLQSSPTSLASCAIDLLKLNVTNPPPSGGGGFDPCAHFGEPGINPCACVPCK